MLKGDYMNRNTVCSLVLLVLLSALLPSGVRAGSIPAVITNSAINVTALGFYDATLTGSGLVGLSNCDGCGEVGIYNSSGTLLVSGLVTTSGTLVGDFYYVSVPTTLLAAGQHYFVVGETGNSDYTFATTGFAVSPDITFLQDAFVFSSTLAFPTSSDGFTQGDGGGFFGANFEESPASTATPEPSSILLLGSSLLMAVGAIKGKILS
jgi:hypothetical protein